MLEENMASDLLNSTLITSLASTRVYPVVIPQDPTYPCIAYQRVAFDAEYTLSGRTNYGQATIQIDSYAKTYMVAKSLADKVHTVIAASTKYKGIFGNEQDAYEPEIEAYRISQDYQCWTVTT